MKLAALPLPRFIQRHIWLWRIAWRDVTGRLYIFRDAPDWVCMEHMRYPEVSARAEAELMLRVNNLRRDIERAVTEAEAKQEQLS